MAVQVEGRTDLVVEVASQTLDADRFHTLKVLVICTGHAVHDTYTGFLAPLLPTLVSALTLSKAQAGLLSVFLQWPSIIQPVLGHLSDRLNLRYLLIIAPAITATMMSLTTTASSYAMLAVFLVVAGLSSAGLHTVGPVLVSRVSGKSIGRGMGFWMASGEIGRFMGPLAIVAAITWLSLQQMLWLIVAGVLTSALLYLQFRSVPAHPKPVAQNLELRRTLSSIGSLLPALIGIIIARSFAVSALSTYLPLFLMEEGADLWFAGASLSILSGAGAVGALMAGTWSDRWGRQKTLFVSLLATSILMLIFLAVSGWIRFVLLFVLGFAALSGTSVLMAIMQERFPGNRALANGVLLALMFLLQSLVVVGLGILGDLFDMRFSFLVSSIVPVLGIPFVLLLPPARDPK
jgi:FSR family fosmidomycin resistance protein-like MFS transporter